MAHRHHHRIGLSLLPVLLALLALPPAFAGAAAEERPGAAITLQLKWLHQFQFAGYYVAKEKGYYRDAGLDVNIVPAIPATDPVRTVLAGDAQFGVAASELAMHRAHGKPVVVLAVIFQHSPLALLARADRGIRNVHDLAGKRVMLAEQETEVYAYLNQEHVALDRLQVVPHSFRVEDLIEGKVDAMAGYVTDEPYRLDQAQIPYLVLSPQSAGIDFYGDSLFTTESYLASHRDQVAAFREASLRGWRYAMENTEETVALIRERYAQDHTAEALRFEAQAMQALIQPNLVELGYSHPGRWNHIADTYSQLGLAPANPSLQGFLYNPSEKPYLTWLYWSGLASFSALAVCAVIIAYIFRLNRRLRRQIREKETVSRELNRANQHLHAQLAEIQALQEQLRRDAIRDSLTGLYNRRYFEETLARELSRAERDAYPVGLAVIDVDYFKQVNDRYGHQGGDTVLHELGQLLERHIRAGDIACRYGGEEFVVVLPNTGINTTRERAEQWRRVCAEHSIAIDGADITVTLSIGIAMFPDHGHSQKTLFAAADQALYRAKRAGRNRLAVFAHSETQP